MIGKPALEVNCVHHATKRSAEIKVYPTLFLMVSFLEFILVGHYSGLEVLNF